MADIPITDNLNVSADLKLADNAPFAKAKLSHIFSTNGSLLAQLGKPLDQVEIAELSLGFSVTTPAQLVDSVTTFAVKAGINGNLKILKPENKTVFPDDGFGPAFSIAPGEYWMGVEIASEVGAKIAATVNGFGVSVADKSTMKNGVYTAFSPEIGGYPVLKSCLQDALNNFRVLHSAADIHAQPVKNIYVSEMVGTVKFKGSYTFPTDVSAFASANLPFNFNVNLAPLPAVTLTGEIALSGSFRIRCLKLPGNIVQLALYKEKGTELDVTLSLDAGLGVYAGETDLISAVFGSALPSVDLKTAGLSKEQQAEIGPVLKASFDRSLALSINTLCSASVTDETAVAYEIRLGSGDTAATDRALGLALAGDWTALGALANVTCLRNVVARTEEHKFRLNINLLGFYNASSVSDYLKACTVLHDENGRILVTDKATAKRLATAASPYLAAAERLDRVLAETMLASITYAATASHLSADLKITQSYLRYAKNATGKDLHAELLLGFALELMQDSDGQAVLSACGDMPRHLRVTAAAEYGTSGALSVFLSDPLRRTCRTTDELTRAARRTLSALIDEDDSAGKVRRGILANDTVWSEMDRTGNMNMFASIPELSRFPPSLIGAIAGDWSTVRWWVNAVSRLGPKLVQVLNAADQITGPDPTANSQLTKSRQELLSDLLAVSQASHAPFAEGWGMAVLYALAQRKPKRSMEFSWNRQTLHFEKDAAPAANSAPGGS